MATVVAALATAAAAILGAQQGTAPAGEPWQAGKCYRVFPWDREQLYIFKVLEPPSGGWVRVETDPAAQRVPGSRPQAPLWLNTGSMFAVQEWTCS